MTLAGDEGRAWYAVRTVCRAGGDGAALEERITLWVASSEQEASRMAERDAGRYVEEQHGGEVSVLQVARLFEEPGHGTEVFSRRLPVEARGASAPGAVAADL